MLAASWGLRSIGAKPTGEGEGVNMLEVRVMELLGLGGGCGFW